MIRFIRNAALFMFVSMAIAVQNPSLLPWNWELYPYPSAITAYFFWGIAACISDTFIQLPTYSVGGGITMNVDRPLSERKPGIVPGWGKRD